jgi:hypothetical protein
MRSPGRWPTLAQWISFGGSWGWSVTYWAATRSAPTFTDRRCSAVSDPALLLTAALAGDHPLTGPPPAQVVDPVPHADLVRASVAGIPGLLDDLDGDTRNVVLTLARIWTTLATGEMRSKASPPTGRWPGSRPSTARCWRMPSGCTSAAGTPRRAGPTS